MLKTESYKKGIIYSTGLNIIAKGNYFLNTLVIVFFFGAGISTDIYFFILSIATLITSGMLNGIDVMVLIPHAMKLRETDGEAASRKFLNFFIFLYLAIGIIFFLAAVVSPVLFYNIFSKFDTAVLQQHIYLLYAGVVLIFFQLINNFLGAILNSYKYFTVTILTSLLTSLCSIIITVLFHKQLGIAGTLAAVAGSYSLNFLFLMFIMKLQLHWQFGNVMVEKNKQLWRNIGLLQLNILPVWLRNYSTLFLLSGLGVGIVSSVNLALQTAGIIDTLLIGQVLSVAGIKFNELYAKKDIILLNEIFIKVASFLLLILMPVVVIIFFYADNIAVLLFKRGNMADSSLATVALCLQYLILLSPLMLLNSICTRILSSAQLLRQGLLYSITAHIIFLILSLVLIYWLQLKGYLYAMLAGYSIIIFFFYYLFKTKLKQIDFGYILKFGLKQLVVNVLIAIPVFLVFKKLYPINFIVLLFIAAFIQAAVIFLINRKQFYFSVSTYLVNVSANKKSVQ